VGFTRLFEKLGSPEPQVQI